MAVLSREQLFEAAWDRPLQEVAGELGVTSAELRKVCDRHDIPMPGRGYWVQVAEGKTYPRPKLRPLSDPRRATIKLSGEGELAPLTGLQSRSANVPVASRPLIPQLPLAALPQDAPRETQVRGLEATAEALTRAKPDPSGFVHIQGKGIIRTKCGISTRMRALKIAGELVGLARAKGYIVGSTDGGLGLDVDGELIEFWIEEKPTRTPHIPTAKELAEKAKRLEWNWQADPWPKYDHSPSGELSVVIQSNLYSGLRRSYSDGRRQNLEALLGDVVVAFEAHAALIKERRAEREAQQRRWEEEAARRRAEAERQALEERRFQFVGTLAKRLSAAKDARRVLAHLASFESEGEVALFRGWLSDHLQQLESELTDTEVLRRSIKDNRLNFDAPDHTK